MSQDQHKKSMRNFSCRDYLWDTFQRMSVEMQCSVDYLINEAMRTYARDKGKQPQGGSAPGRPAQPQMSPSPAKQPSFGGPKPPQPGNQFGTPAAGAPGAAPPPAFGAAPPQAGPPQAGPPSPGGFGAPPSKPGGAPSGFGGGFGGTAKPPGSFGQSGRPPASIGGGGFGTPARGQTPFGGQPAQPNPASTPPPLPSAQSRPMLYLIFNNQKIPVSKDEFVIGRGSKTSDLAIKDGNISRQHAAVVFQNGEYVIRDLDSTNGMEHNGRQIKSKSIQEGDVINICDYELRFTYQ